MPLLMSVADAHRRIMTAFTPLETEMEPLTEAVGRVLSENIRAELDLPPFSNSSMDGFAVRVTDVESASPTHPVLLEVVDDAPAGKVTDVAVRPGQTVRIMTGAPIPNQTEAVVPVEYTDFSERDPGTPAPPNVQIFQQVGEGVNIRPKGQDVQKGELVYLREARLRPQDIGLLAMLGISEVPVYLQPRVAVFSTGDELIPVELPIEPGKIHDSNTYTLIASVERYGGCPVNLGIAPDRAESVQACLDKAVAEKVDLILSSAGVSVGAFDFVRSVVEKRGQLEFWRVNMRPGKPIAFGKYKGIPFIGLPGNPVSAFVGFEVFVHPALMRMSGLINWNRPVHRVKLLEAVESDGRESYLRAIVDFRNGYWGARLTGHQGSGNMRSLVQANALLIIPSGKKSLKPGDEIDAWFLEDIW